MSLPLNQIICGDAREILGSFPSQSIDLIITSPPYFVGKEYEVQYVSFEDYLSYLSPVWVECKRLLKKAGFLCINIDDAHISFKRSSRNETENLGTHAYLITELKRLGFVYRDSIIWEKVRANNPSGGSTFMLGSFPYPPNIPILAQYEFILIFKNHRTNLALDRSTIEKARSKIHFDEFKSWAYGMWHFPGEHNSEHPTPFPEELPKRLIRLFTFHGDVVLDPFAGSGTTCVVARKLCRNYIGIDINPAYVEMAKKRLSQIPQRLDVVGEGEKQTP